MFISMPARLRCNFFQCSTRGKMRQFLCCAHGRTRHSSTSCVTVSERCRMLFVRQLRSITLYTPLRGASLFVWRSLAAVHAASGTEIGVIRLWICRLYGEIIKLVDRFKRPTQKTCIPLFENTVVVRCRWSWQAARSRAPVQYYLDIILSFVVATLCTSQPLTFTSL